MSPWRRCAVLISLTLSAVQSSANLKPRTTLLCSAETVVKKQEHCITFTNGTAWPIDLAIRVMYDTVLLKILSGP
jgi:hypothetical protein